VSGRVFVTLVKLTNVFPAFVVGSALVPEDNPSGGDVSIDIGEDNNTLRHRQSQLVAQDETVNLFVLRKSLMAIIILQKYVFAV